MNIKKSTTKIIIIALAVFLFLGLAIHFNFLSVFAANIGESCSEEWDCDHTIYGSGTSIMEKKADCVSGTCIQDGGDNEIYNCTGEDNSYCSTTDTVTMLKEIYHAETGPGGVCCVIDEVKSTDCSANNGTHCAGDNDQIIKDIWTCSGGSCVHHEENGEVCSDRDNKYCSGDNVIQRSYSCSGGSCSYTDSTDEYCNDRDGDYCDTGDILEERNYTCQDDGDDAYCTYTVPPGGSISCSTTYGDRSFCTSYGTYGQNSDCESYPEATNLDWNYDDHNYDSGLHGTDDYPYCGRVEPYTVTLFWNFNSQTSDNYFEVDLQISRDAAFTNLIVVEDGLTPITTYTVSADLDFDTTYYWRVRVKDENGHWSNDGGYSWSESTFTTDKKRCDADFSYQPPQPFVEEQVDFTNQTTPGDVSIASWYWTFDNATPPNSTEENPSIEFNISGTNQVKLESTDQDGVTCSHSEIIGARKELPIWQEIDPFN
jgi:hypothetical protein